VKPQRGYYSLIQFCPDAARMESVNVGVALYCPESGFLEARTSGNNSRAEKLVGKGQLEKSALNAAKLAIQRRFEVDREAFLNLEDFQQFVHTRANSLQLTEGRPVKVFEPKADLERLFEELVDGKSSQQGKRNQRVLFPILQTTFEKLRNEGRGSMDLKVKIPLVGKSMSIPYAYQNGKLNLVKTQQFPENDNTAINAAIRLAMEGDLVKRHGVNADQQAQLIVVSAFDNSHDTQLIQRVTSLFQEYEIENISPAQVDDFAVRVLREAH